MKYIFIKLFCEGKLCQYEICQILFFTKCPFGLLQQWDNYHGIKGLSGVFETPDHDEFYSVATAYSFAHPHMNDTRAACRQWGAFKDGVTNGADWYPVFGGMQDFNYLFAGTMEVTVEVSCCKHPHPSRLLREWEFNRDSIFTYVEQAQRGITGEVTNSTDGRPVQGAK